MLVLSRKAGQKIVINNDITITVLESKGGKVRLGIDAPVEIPIQRAEIVDRCEQPVAPTLDTKPSNADILGHSLPSAAGSLAVLPIG